MTPMDIVRETQFLKAQTLLLRIVKICDASERIETDGASLDEEKSYVYWGLYNDQYHLLEDIKTFLKELS